MRKNDSWNRVQMPPSSPRCWFAPKSTTLKKGYKEVFKNRAKSEQSPFTATNTKSTPARGGGCWLRAPTRLYLLPIKPEGQRRICPSHGSRVLVTLLSVPWGSAACLGTLGHCWWLCREEPGLATGLSHKGQLPPSLCRNWHQKDVSTNEA